MKHKLIHTPNYLLVVDDSEIKEGNKSLLNIEGFVPMILTHHEPIEEGYEGKKIIAHLPLNNSPILEGVDLLAPLENKVEYNKDKENYKYTEKDIKVMVNDCVIFAMSNTHLSVGEYATQFKDFYDKCIQSLSQTKMPVAFECDVKSFEQEYRIPIREVRITTLEGHIQWVGKYIY